MAQTCTTYEAKAKFSELLRKVRSGQGVVITYRGERVAEMRRYQDTELDLKKRLARLEDEGVILTRPTRGKQLRPLARRPGALERFLESRE